MGGDLNKVAIHEAAHSVAAYKLGGQVGSIKLDGRRSGNEISWQGVSSNDTTGLSQENVAAIAFAGPLAEAKHLASRQFPTNSTLTISPSCLPKILEALRQAAQFNNPERMYASVELSEGDNTIAVDVFFGDSCGDFRAAVSHVQEDDLLVAMEIARSLVDDTNAWAAINHLAQKLCNVQPQDYVRRDLSEKITKLELRKFLEKSSKDTV